MLMDYWEMIILQVEGNIKTIFFLKKNESFFFCL